MPQVLPCPLPCWHLWMKLGEGDNQESTSSVFELILNLQIIYENNPKHQKFPILSKCLCSMDGWREERRASVAWWYNQGLRSFNPSLPHSESSFILRWAARSLHRCQSLPHMTKSKSKRSNFWLFLGAKKYLLEPPLYRLLSMPTPEPITGKENGETFKSGRPICSWRLTGFHEAHECFYRYE